MESACRMALVVAVGLPDRYDVSQTVDHLITIAIALVIAIPLGWDRERARAGSGFRTFPLVAVASCGFLLLLGESSDEATRSRLVSGLMAGVGFIGGGAILKREDSVSGTATAAAIWATGALGAAVAMGKYEIACVLSAVTFVTLRWGRPIAQRLAPEPSDPPEDTTS